MQENETVGLLIKMIHERIATRANAELKEYNMTISQMQILCYLNQRERETVSIRDIETYFHITHTTVIGLVRRLEEKSYVESVLNYDDKRVHNIRITEQGKAIHKLLYKNKIRMEEELIKGLTSEQETQLRVSLMTLYNNLSK